MTKEPETRETSDQKTENSLRRIAGVIREGGIALIPTDTVYALVASIQYAEAVDRLFEIKKRDRARSLPLLLSRPEVALEIGAFQESDLPILKKIWPGPWTLVVKARVRLTSGLVGPDGMVALRCPNHGLALEVLRRAGGTLAVTSANFSGSPSAVHFDDVDPFFLTRVQAFLDAGACPLGASTAVARIEAGGVKIVREGCVSAEQLKKVKDLLSHLSPVHVG